MKHPFLGGSGLDKMRHVDEDSRGLCAIVGLLPIRKPVAHPAVLGAVGLVRCVLIAVREMREELVARAGVPPRAAAACQPRASIRGIRVSVKVRSG